MEEILKQLNSIAKDISQIKVIVAVQSEQLKEHMRRTNLLEVRIEQVSKDSKIQTEAIENSIKPVQKHVDQINGALKLIGLIATLVSIIGVVWKFIN